MSDAVLKLADLTVRLTSGEAILEGVGLELREGEVVGLVGESGSGKTTLALSVLGHIPSGLAVTSGTLSVSGEEVSIAGRRQRRGRRVSYVPQDCEDALNPALRVVESIADLLHAHPAVEASGVTVWPLLEAVGLPASTEFGRRYPHQLSGGQQQRVCVAMSLTCDPTVIVLDEPTTGLDVITQERILRELIRLKQERGVAMLYVSHDLSVVGELADRVAVMYAGRVVEWGEAEEVLLHPKHPYTRGLLASIPDHRQPRILEPMPGIAPSIGNRPAGCPFVPRCPQATSECSSEMPPASHPSVGRTVRCFHWEETPPLRIVPLEVLKGRAEKEASPILSVRNLCAEHRSRHEIVVAARDISFDVNRGSCVALVGESGSGKTTIARSIAGLHPFNGGTVELDGQALATHARKRTLEQRRRVQIVFQNPTAALNPRHTIRGMIARPAQVLRGVSRRSVDAEVVRLLECVRLPAHVADRYPVELSGGERQRAAIARALAAEPDLVLCDEITSALDVSVQAAILELLSDLRRDLDLSLVLITHNLGVVAALADEVLVLQQGEICERGLTASVLEAPQHPYTRRLLEAAPSVGGRDARLKTPIGDEDRISVQSGSGPTR